MARTVPPPSRMHEREATAPPAVAEGEQLLPRSGDRPVWSLRVGRRLAVAEERVVTGPMKPPWAPTAGAVAASTPSVRLTISGIF
ncbi:hypothetical protein [Streptomyces sp. NBC_00576]|uniref:hypothetical protein n=1 Tax=Streptomyces sp. NBC_00576 TaxID=2903665 RepID=UPI002E80AEB5|nr:hypothetical protein [Streptomyces sp. NBC_00576]WUB77668.1 hypothetical protein OG734_47715 [Streptomyces sp. NBC_00576]